MDHIANKFAALRKADQGGLVAFVTAGDPDFKTSLEIIKGLPGAGADVIELGMPFSDPMADGPTIQAASLRALETGMNLQKTLDLAAAFRKDDDTTPIVLMGYYNPIHSFGVEKFLSAAKTAGVDGFIVVDLPPEEDTAFCLPARAAGLHFIRLITPTTDDTRLPVVLKNSSGFVYYVSVAGITGAKTGGDADIAAAVARIRKHTDLPVAVGFGIKTPEQVAAVTQHADAAVVGSAIVSKIAEGVSVQDLHGFVGRLSGKAS